MALPMVHLLAAWEWAKDKPALKCNPDYYLGAISPDAIHIRDGNDKSHKDEIHLNNWRSPAPEEVVNYWKRRRSPFDIGYGIHVLLDAQWASGFRRDFPEMLLPDGKPDTEIYYSDTVVTDFALYRKCPQTSFFVEMLKSGCAAKDHPLLTAEEFDQWRQDVLRFYQRPCPMKRPARFLTEEYVKRFLKRCMALFDQTYERGIIMNETQRSILDRRSTRGFNDVALTADEIGMLQEAAFASPTACNYQDWHFCFVTNRELLDAFSAEYRQILMAKQPNEKNVHYDVFFHAPLVVFITLPTEPKSNFAQVDAGIAVENLALSAQGMGLGSVILGRPKEVFVGSNGAAWEKKFRFPQGHCFAIAIAIGHNTVTKDAHVVGEGKFTRVD